MTSFETLKLTAPLLNAVSAQNYTQPTPIQTRAIPPLLEGKDVLGCAQTGTGKTAAFALPILQRLSARPNPSGRRTIRALVLSPTRELAQQIGDSFRAYGRFLKLRHHVIVGGVNPNPQIRALRRGTDILVATPGRLLDLCRQGEVDLSTVEFFVLDEADRMLDMGFIPDIRRILKQLPKDRQNLLFSATLPSSIDELGASFLKQPVRVDIAPDSPTVDRIGQRVMFVKKGDKVALLTELLEQENVEQAIIFTRTKHGANRLTQKLDRGGFKVAVIHGNKSQSARRRALDDFRKGGAQLLVATDIAARGIDVDTISHVFNYDLPNEADSYVHRIGRTARAGRSGTAISFCDDSETAYLNAIEKTVGEPIAIDVDHIHHHAQAMTRAASKSGSRSNSRSKGGPRGGQNRSRNGRSRHSSSRSSSSSQGQGDTSQRPRSRSRRSRHSENRPS